MKLLALLTLLFALNFSNAQNDSLQSINFNEHPVTVIAPFELTTPVHTFVYEDYEHTFLTYVSYKPLNDTLPETDILVNVADYMDCLSILDYLLDDGKYLVKVYLAHEMNPLKKGSLWFEEVYAVLKKN